MRWRPYVVASVILHLAAAGAVAVVVGLAFAAAGGR